MSEATTLVALIKAVADGPAWHGPSVAETLHGLDAEQARSHPVYGVHSIWELLVHMNIWQQYTLDVLNGAAPLSEEDVPSWPSVPAHASENEWMAVKHEFTNIGNKLKERLLRFTDEQLRAKVGDSKLSNKVLLHGIVSHNLYHCGQIAMLRKAIESAPPSEPVAAAQ